MPISAGCMSTWPEFNLYIWTIVAANMTEGFGELQGNGKQESYNV